MVQQKPDQKKSPVQSGGSRKKDGDSAAPTANADNRRELRPVQPEFWDNVLPPWFEEIGAIVLLVFGVISFMALAGISPDAPLSRAWSDALTRLFGYGSLMISLGIFALGVIILLPRVGIRFNLNVRRLLALEIAFLSLLAIFHLAAGDSDLRLLARSGGGGGFAGWGMVYLPHLLVGPVVSLMLFVVIFAVAVGVLVGVRRDQLRRWLERAQKRLKSRGQRLTSMPVTGWPGLGRRRRAAVRRARLESTLALDDSVTRRFTVMRIRPDMANLPPSLRSAPRSTPADDEPDPLDETDQRLARAFTQSQNQTDYPGEVKTDNFNAIGELLPRKGKDPQMVRRPDGRIKRYFTVESMREPKKVAKREKSLPPLDLLQDVEINPPDEEEINHNVVLIENTLLEFDIHVDVVDVKIGPTVTQYAVQPFQEKRGPDGEIVRERTRLSKIAALASDLSLALSAKRLRLETPVPGQSFMGVEVPNRNPSMVALRSVYESKTFHDRMAKSRSPLLVPLGRDVSGAPMVVDLAGMPHLLVAGTTGSGKSVLIAALATALVLNNTPDRVKLIMLDPKMVELSRFNGLPHLLGPVETDMERIIGVLRWCTREMERRYKLLEEQAARNIEIFNSRLGQRRQSEHLPYMVIMVDEIGDLMMSKPEETERSITRLAQMARAVGMHLIVATQRPSVDVITGLIKANFPARISFAVASGVDSRVILDHSGAETLLGSGDMLYLAQDAAGPRRLQGCYVDDSEVRAVVNYWREWQASSEPGLRNIAPWERALTRREFLAETDPMLEDAIELVVEEQEASASQIQRKLGLGYPRAARIIDLLEELGVIGDPVVGGRSRKVLIEKGKDPFKAIIEKRAKRGGSAPRPTPPANPDE